MPAGARRRAPAIPPRLVSRSRSTGQGFQSMTRIRRIHALAWLVFVPQLTGCDAGTPAVDTSSTEATVSGVVTVKGFPAKGGEIRFNPSNHLRIVPTRSAPIGEDGSYKITTLTGVNAVSFDGEVATKNQGVGLLKEYPDLKAGENKVDFDLMGEGVKLPYNMPAKKKGGR